MCFKPLFPSSSVGPVKESVVEGVVWTLLGPALWSKDLSSPKMLLALELHGATLKKIKTTFSNLKRNL
jgi:hypothetical protein